jgi:predicted NAD-dependent protein-ADP-ribosyltransferase YbiA (DUF1768 family)
LKYSIHNLPCNISFIFFWGHQPSTDGVITKACFSQWWQRAFMVDGINYYTAEHWMMAKKAELFEKNMLAKILEICTKPNQV